jgi:oligoendopeptidase F
MKYKTEWDLTHIYKADPKRSVEKDCAALKKAYSAFAKKYRKDKSYLKSPKALAKAIEDYEKLIKHPASDRPYLYYGYRKELNSQDSEAEAELSKLSEFYANLGNEVQFFELEIGKIPAPLQKKMLSAKELREFKYLLTKIFENAKHDLSEAEEKILNLKSQTSYELWVSGAEKLLNKQTVELQGKQVPWTEAAGKLSSLPTPERRALHKELMKAFEKVSDFAESEINAIVINKKVNDKLRGFKIPFESTVLKYQNEAKTIKNLLDAVNGNMGISHRFFKIKADMLGEKKLTYADRSAKVGKVDVKMPFEEAVDRTIRSFNSADPEFGAYVEKMLLSGLVDVFPKKNKSGGAFCSYGNIVPTYVLLNHTDEFRSLTTLAHEMGHALHGLYSKKQRPLYENCTMSTAEVASTFFENLVFEEALENVGEYERMILLHDKINADLSTIFRQIACFNFENELHETIRKEGFLSKEKICELMNKHMQAYLGPIFELKLEDGYFFVNWSHLRKFFYVYTYAFGQLVSDALYERYKKDKSKIKDVIQFLSAGGSDSPEGIFRSIGINPTKQFFELGLKRIERDIDELEKLWKKHKNVQDRKEVKK